MYYSEHFIQHIITDLSDHNMVDVMLSFNLTDSNRFHVNVFDENEFRSLDFTQADFSEVRKKLDDVNWEDLRMNSTFEEFPRLFMDILYQIVPQSRRSQRLVNHEKKAKFKVRSLEAAELGGNTQRINCLKSTIALLCFQIKEQMNE